MQIPNFFTGYAAQSGQAPYAVRPAWNVAGVDYPVGNYTAPPNLKDIRQSQPPGCALQWYGPSLAVLCNGSGALVISNYRFDLYGGTWLIIDSTNYTSMIVKNSYFLNGSNSDRANGALIIITGTGGDFTLQDSTLDGAGRTQTLGLAYLVMDGRGGNQRDTFWHNAFFRSPQKTIGTGPCGNTDIEYNYFEELELSSSHGEFTIDGTTPCTKDKFVESYNTFLLTSGLVRTGTGGIVTMMYLSGGNASRSWNTIVASHNTLVSNNIGSVNVAPGLGGHETTRIIEENYGNVYRSIQYTSNFIDPTGTLLCYYVPTPTPNSTIMQGNTNLLDGSAIDSFAEQDCKGLNHTLVGDPGAPDFPPDDGQFSDPDQGAPTADASQTLDPP